MSYSIQTTARAGISLIEIIISITIITVIAGLGLTVGLGFYKTFSLDSEQAVVISVLRAARNGSINNLNQSAWGVYFTPTAYTYFQGSTYASRIQQYDKRFIVAPAITISGLSEVDFSQLSGNAAQSGTITLSATNSSRTITINSAGGINW